MSVKGFKFGNGAVQKYDYNELDNKLELDVCQLEDVLEDFLC